MRNMFMYLFKMIFKIYKLKTEKHYVEHLCKRRGGSYVHVSLKGHSRNNSDLLKGNQVAGRHRGKEIFH